MPTRENQFYIDKPEYGKYYRAFVSEELMDITRKMFLPSRNREDNFIVGLSMEG